MIVNEGYLRGCCGKNSDDIELCMKVLASRMPCTSVQLARVSHFYCRAELQCFVHGTASVFDDGQQDAYAKPSVGFAFMIGSTKL